MNDKKTSGNMILIKDRHMDYRSCYRLACHFGKYDTYKGSTRMPLCAMHKSHSGKYDTYKGSTLKL